MTRALRSAGSAAILLALSLSVSSHAIAASARQSTPTVPCESLVGLDLPQAKVVAAKAITSGSFKPDDNAKELKNLPPFCRVRVVVRPEINVEIWMPLNKWNGKLFGFTPGGMLGAITYEHMPYMMGDVGGLESAIRHGYAGISTDGGHNCGDNNPTCEPSPGSNNNWLNDLGRVIDFGYRGAHEMALKGKLVAAAFYAQQPAHTYFSSCSGGGRVAMMAAQRYPDDFDGIIAGDPGANWNDLELAQMWFLRATTDDPAANIPLSKLPAIHNLALAQCDANDGLKDGIISNPLSCKIDPGVLQCKGAEDANCLTAPQVQAVRKFYAGLTYPDGRHISYGLLPGSELGWTSYTGITDGNKQGGASTRNYIKNGIFNDPNYDVRQFDWDRDVDFMKEKTEAIVDATNPDLTQFKARGGKLLEYYGWADGLAPPGFTLDYHESVVKKIGSRAAVDDFYRLFMLPGMGHCTGGSGPDKFDAVDALENWVEKGVAPDRMIATRADKDGKVDMARPICPYPQGPKYSGVGSPNEARNFYCAAP
jgi:feruloyl esterase